MTVTLECTYVNSLFAGFVGTGMGPTSMAPLLFFIPGNSAHQQKDSDVEPNSVLSYQVICGIGILYLMGATALLSKIRNAR